MSSSRYNSGNFAAEIANDLWDSFWSHPNVKCPKCGCNETVYYDPFFFSPIRTLKGKRRIRCTSCHFIWRPTRRKQSFWEKCKKII